MNNQGNWYTFHNSDKVDTPALLIYPERVTENIRRLIAMVASPGLLRPHVKTNKSSRVSRLMIDAGINKFKCATITEAAMLGRIGAADVLLAYQPTQTKLNRLVELIKTYPNTQYSCLVDNQATADMLAATAAENDIQLSVFIDLNVGMNRTGIHPDQALQLYQYISNLPGINLKGLHAYDGHIGDEDIKARTNQCEKAFAPVEKLRDDISELGKAFPLLIAGGSPTFTIHAKRAHTECSPGTFVFWDKGYSEHIPEQDFLFAAVVLARVVSFPDEDKMCIDLGYKAIACEKPLENRAYFLNATRLKAYSQSEEHLVIEVPNNHGYKIGDEFFVLPKHICPTVAMYDNAHIIADGHFKEKWAIDARGRE